MSISMGKSKGKTTQQQQQTATQTLDPQLAAQLYGNIASAQSAAGSLKPYTGQRVASFNANQTAAQAGLLDLAKASVGKGLLGAATSAAGQASAYKPMSITPTTLAGPAGTTAATAAARPDVTTSAIGADAIHAYMNPYEDDVVSTSLADLERQRQIEQTYNAAQATKAKAFGGTGAAILSSQTNDNFSRNAASTAANLRSQGYNTALSAAQADAARRLQADRPTRRRATRRRCSTPGRSRTATSSMPARRRPGVSSTLGRTSARNRPTRRRAFRARS